MEQIDDTLRQKIDDMIVSLERPRIALSEWELNFMTNIYDKFYEFGFLTKNQLKKLEEIYNEKGA